MNYHQPIHTPSLPRPGDILLGRYVIEGVIGRGGFGAVYRGRQLGVDRVVAIKCLDPASVQLDPGAPQRFAREARLASGLEHYNTITVFDYGRTETGILFLVMEYVEGMPLHKLLQRGVIEAERAIRLIKQVLYSLREAHAKSIIHRDLKPANIMVCDRAGDRDVVKVLDFGIAKTLGEQQGMGTDITVELTGSDKLIGTPRYMSPEQIRGETLSPASDLYSVGLIFYEMLLGKPAIESQSTMVVLGVQLRHEPIEVPMEGVIQTSLATILKRSIEKDPSRRFRSADEFLGAFDMSQGVRIGKKQVVKNDGAPTEKLTAEHIKSLEKAAAPTMARQLSDYLPAAGVPAAVGASSDHGVIYASGLYPPVRSGFNMTNLLLGAILLLLGVALGVVIIPYLIRAGAQVPVQTEFVATQTEERAVELVDTRHTPSRPPVEQSGAPPVRESAAASGAVQAQVAATALSETRATREFLFAGTPPNAEIYQGQTLLSSANERLTMASNQLPVEIEIRSGGYEPHRTTLSSAGSTMVTYQLRRVEVPPPQVVSATRTSDTSSSTPAAETPSRSSSADTSSRSSSSSQGTSRSAARSEPAETSRSRSRSTSSRDDAQSSSSTTAATSSVEELPSIMLIDEVDSSSSRPRRTSSDSGSRSTGRSQRPASSGDSSESSTSIPIF